MKIKCRNIFLAIFVLWYVNEFICGTTLKAVFGIPTGWIDSMVKYLTLGLLLIQIAFGQTYKKKEFTWIGIISVPFIITAAVSGNYSLLSAWMFVIAAKDVDFDKIVKAVYRILYVMIPLTIILRFAGVMEEFTKPRGEAVRYSLGFSHPNQLGIVLFQFVVCHCYLHRKKLKITDYLLIVAVILFIYIAPNSQSAYLSIFAFLILSIFCGECQKHSLKIADIYGKVILLFAFLLNVVSIFLSVVDIRLFPLLWKMDALISNRFATSYNTFQIYGIKIWGQKVFLYEEERIQAGMADGAGRLYLDNSYMTLLIKYGVISYLIFSIAYLLLMDYFRKKEQYFMVTVLFMFALYGVMENCMFSAFHNVYLLAFAQMLYGKLGEEKGGLPSSKFFAAILERGKRDER